ncbi:glycoside hydrolase family 15 protein [Xanthomonas nasturtii]|uniref:Glycoside hydrolase family 15 protein n=1 Tax=Xanthomonas nasturtii TaxID=1843581 RepID=A0ABT0LLJ3_9XANT|nr:glycoside hydrolase family 15 protein [Xanthomonas nasturtii]MCL1526545.1 glycoside hydrolase family 15 protein [Xanthomonas nasturtii]MCL1534109.1 glycoside hydrolase family 15 protein [Xanthomonas nasturtii]MCL1543934.1 glycoside hydrolase family 15 protein [Xanthomonas nasturtii]MCL1550210.1 glycoside hydrolase family 15 protein [Xanthomonas nasturtii]MCL1555365.1 glycoside hydrolase family 15 protein [Xanthomonas nasturtii]
MSVRIEDHAMLGNCHSAALVDHRGTIDWLCLPRFDSDAVFASLLGDEQHGQWALSPAADFRTERAYEDDSLVLRTRMSTDSGTVELVDFMVASEDTEIHQHLVRIVRCVQGSVPMHMRLTFRFNYGRTVPWVTRIVDGIRAIAGPDQLALRSPQTLHGENMGTETDFTLREGESTWFLLSHGASHLATPPLIDPEQALQRTAAFWHGWARRCTDVGPWTEQVRRSLVVLKGLSYLPTGGIVAAPTASLPEHLGGTRNWDYRYCWLRDSVFTLIALLQAGYRDEAVAFRAWVQRTIAGSPDQLQALYGIAGERRLQEWEAHWLPGYEHSGPVRIGNGAVDQFQLDVYGELIGAFHYAREKGVGPPSDDDGSSASLLEKILDTLETLWREPDEGIWEIRDERRHFVHSKVMAWLAFDCGARDGITNANTEKRAHWGRLAEEIRAEVLEKGVHPDGHFVQSYGSDRLDASLLLIPIVGFLPADDPRIAATADAIARDLTIDGLVERYRADDSADGLPAGEGTFLACSFWLVENYALIGRTDQARALLERLLGLCNDVGLLAEEYDPRSKRMLGNFPQGYSHVALVNAALRLHGCMGEKETHP